MWRPIEIRKCTQCGRRYEYSYATRQRFCSHACRQPAYRDRQLQEARVQAVLDDAFNGPEIVLPWD